MLMVQVIISIKCIAERLKQNRTHTKKSIAETINEPNGENHKRTINCTTKTNQLSPRCMHALHLRLDRLNDKAYRNVHKWVCNELSSSERKIAIPFSPGSFSFVQVCVAHCWTMNMSCFAYKPSQTPGRSEWTYNSTLDLFLVNWFF